MEEISATIPKYQPLQVLWCPLCDYAQRTILSHPIRPFTRELHTFIVGRINILKLIEIGSAILLIQPYKCLPVTKHILFLWACGSFRKPRKFFQTLFLYIHLFVKYVTHSFLHGFQPNLYQHFSYVRSTCHTIIYLK